MWICGRASSYAAMGSSDRSLMDDPMSYFSFQPVVHDWYNKDHAMCYPVCGMVHIKEPLLLIKIGIPCSGLSGFSLSLSECFNFFYHNVRRHITVNKIN